MASLIYESCLQVVVDIDTILEKMAIDLDPTTQANYAQITSAHVDLDWTIDFDKRTVAGSATHTFEVKEDGVKEIMCASLFNNIAMHRRLL